MARSPLTLMLSLALLSASALLQAKEIHIAVASNFAPAMKEIARRFEEKHDHTVVLSVGSTGKHYAQIRHGAPFSAFFAADQRRPQLLEEAGIAQPGSRFTYAIGKVVLWSPDPTLINDQTIKQLTQFRHLAIANPKLAPYGRAAQEILQQRALWQPLRTHLVRGENIGQTFQFVNSGNVPLGFVAYTQIQQPGAPTSGSFWHPPASDYTPIRQQAVLLKEDEATRQLLQFVQQPEIHTLLASYGYETP